MNENDPKNTTMPRNDAPTAPRPGVLGEHPVGVSVGAIGAGAAAGAAGGALGGPIGAVAGAAVGAVVGGLAGKAAAEAINPGLETEYWRQNYASRPYADPSLGYDEYGPAYRYGWESFSRRGSDDGTFDCIEADLARGWDKAKGASHLAWDKAKEASRDAWGRAQAAVRPSGKRTTD